MKKKDKRKNSQRDNLRRICIDLDGTIVENEYPAFGRLKNNAKKVINELYDNYKICILTARLDPELNNFDEDKILLIKKNIETFLKEKGIKFDEIKGKPVALLYIDDRGHRFTGWNRTEIFLNT